MILLLFFSWISFGSSLEGNSNRNLENLISRLNTRLDQRLDAIEHKIATRIDHLENRLGRLQSLVSTRLDSIENSLTTTKLRLDMMNEDVHENLNRKWKNFESKIESSVNGLDIKYESKLNLLLREGRRFGDSVHGLFTNVEKRIATLVGQVNSSLIQFSELSFNTSLRHEVPNQYIVTTTTPTPSPSPPQANLVSNKVSNMFDDLVERTLKIETALKDTIAVTNATRRDVLIAIRASSGGGASRLGGNFAATSASEATSMAILETLASTESMSSTISRRLSDLTRSIEERFELVSMTINSFFESCVRIQEGAPLIEEHISEILEKILDSFENSTTSLDYSKLLYKLDTIEMKCEEADKNTTDRNDVLLPETIHLMQQHRIATNSPPSSSNANSHHAYDHHHLRSINNTYNGSNNNDINSNNNNNRNLDEIMENSNHLGEEDKKLLWESLFPISHLNMNSSSNGNNSSSSSSNSSGSISTSSSSSFVPDDFSE